MTDRPGWLSVFARPKMAVILALGFSSGLPLFLTSKTLQAWLTVAQVDLTTIGLFSLVSLPYSLKFLWSPLLDRYMPPLLGRRRGWIALAQIALGVAVAGMAAQDPRRAVYVFAANALLIAFLSASQDIAVDAYRADVLEESEMGAGAAVYVLGYRVALLVTGSLALVLADRMSWPMVYLCLGLLMLLSVGATLAAPEPPQSRPPETMTQAVVEPFRDFFARWGVRGALILFFITLYRFGDSLLGNMATPFLLKSGFSQTDVGAIQGGLGLGATIVGALAGGAVLSRIGIHRSLWVFGGLQAASNLMYWLLALSPAYGLMVVSIVVENLCGGLATAGFVAFLMSLCSRRFSATQYALLTSLMAVSRDVLVAPAGRLAESLGWPGFFLLTLGAALPGLALLPVFAPWNASQQSRP